MIVRAGTQNYFEHKCVCILRSKAICVIFPCRNMSCFPLLVFIVEGGVERDLGVVGASL